MVILITGATHTGKTRLAQELLERYHFPYVCQDHIKMGLIRGGYTDFTPMHSDEELTGFLWPLTREMIKTAIENRQNLIVEGCYVPFDWRKDFEEKYLECIKYLCLCLDEQYIRNHFRTILEKASCIESRLDDTDCTEEMILRENRRFRDECIAHSLEFVYINRDYERTVENAIRNLKIEK